MFETFFLLLISHAVCDFALQNDYMAQAKNKNTEIGKDVWFMVLPAHALIHAGGVYIVTQSLAASLIQFFINSIVDFAKCDSMIGYKTDQLFHVLTMLFIAFLF